MDMGYAEMIYSRQACKMVRMIICCQHPRFLSLFPLKCQPKRHGYIREDTDCGDESDEDGKEWLSLTWLAQESQPEVNVVLLVGLSVSSVGVHIDHSFAANMKQQP